MALSIILAISIFSVVSSSDYKAINITAEVGTNITLYAFTSVEQNNTDDITWYKENEYVSSDTLFSGKALCMKRVHFKSHLHFDCDGYNLYLQFLYFDYSGIYNCKKTINNTKIVNTYYNLTVVQLRKPNCVVSSQYLAKDYCFILINCTAHHQHTKIIYGKNISAWYFNLKGEPKMQNNYQTNVSVGSLHRVFNHTYDFTDLCQNTLSLEYNEDYVTIPCIIIIIVSCIALTVEIVCLIYCKPKSRK